MQIEKHIKIIPTPTGAVVFFAGQVCLTVGEHSGRYTWSISPVFARLTTGISNCFQVPMAMWGGQPTLAEAIADGLTKLDEMQAFYGVIDIPEDTYVGEHLNEGTDYSGVEADVKRTGKSHEQLASEHRAYAKQMRATGKDGLAVRSEMLAKDHDKASKKTNESVDDILSESFVVRQVGQSRNHPPRIMISAAAVIGRAREMAKEAGEKSHIKFIKLAHNEIAAAPGKMLLSKLKNEELDEGSVSKEKQKTPYRDINSPEYKTAAQKQKELMAKEIAAAPGKMLLSKLKNEEFIQYEEGLLKNIKRGLQGWGKVQGTPSEIVKRNKDLDTDAAKSLRKGLDSAPAHSPAGLQKRVLDRKLKNEEFVQYEDALPDVFQLIKEDCRAEALTMTDSLIEAQQLANELFEDIVEEYLNELSKSTLGSYVKNAAYHASHLSSNAGSFKTKAVGHISDRDGKMKPAHDISDANWEKYHTDDEESDRQTKIKMKRHAGINKAIEKMTKEEVEEIDEATHQELLDSAQKAYVEATRKGNGTMARHYGAEILKHKANIAAIGARAKKLKEEVELDEAKIPFKIGAKVKRKDNGKNGVVHSIASDGNSVNVTWAHGSRVPQAVHKLNLKIANEHEEVELDEAALSGDAYWKSKEEESKQEFLKAQRKALGLPEPVKRGRGKPTLIDRDLLKTRAHSNVEAGKRPTAGFDRNEKIHFVRHLKNHPDFADKHVSQAGRPTGTTKVAKEQKVLAKKKQDSAFSMWAGLGKR